jgi:hypothetical protein
VADATAATTQHSGPRRMALDGTGSLAWYDEIRPVGGERMKHHPVASSGWKLI